MGGRSFFATAPSSCSGGRLLCVGFGVEAGGGKGVGQGAGGVDAQAEAGAQEGFGAGLAAAGAVLVLFRVSPPVCLLLIFGGLVYTLAVEYWLKEQAEK